MQVKKKICKTCKTEQFIWKSSNCKSCSSKINPTKPIKKSYLSKKPTEKALLAREKKNKWLEELHNWEFALFDEQKDEKGCCYCFETGIPMHESIYKHNLCIYSHCYPKQKYPDLAMFKWNLLIVLPEIHSQWELDKNKTPKMKLYFETVCKIEFNKFYE